MRLIPQHRAPLLLSAPLTAMMCLAGYLGIHRLNDWYANLLQRYPEMRQPLEMGGLPSLLSAARQSLWIFVTVFFLTSLAALMRRPLGLSLLRKGYLTAYLLLAFYVAIAWHATGLLQQPNLMIQGGEVDSVRLFFWRWEFLWPALVALLVIGTAHVNSGRSSVIALYCPNSPQAAASSGQKPRPRRETERASHGSSVLLAAPGAPSLSWGDRILENLRTHGRDPAFRRGLILSILAHLLVLVIIPALLRMEGCVDPVYQPKGSGNPVVALVKVVRPQKVKKTRRFVLNPQSAISFHVPDLDESQLLKQIEQVTEQTYQADPNRVTSAQGKMGAGGGKTGGWPDGSDKAVFRFIRLRYNGPQWDDGMDAVSNADRNFLKYFHQITGFRVAAAGEENSMGQLTRYPKGYAPAFVYMTGSRHINASASEIRALREYLTDGGMLFADAGSPDWHYSFRNFIAQVLPGQTLVTISDDDPIFQAPFVFANGAPPLWHHGGNKAMGIKVRGRWLVFYHPGDVNDAWKTGGSGINPQLSKQAFELGANVVYYATTQYLQATRQYRK